MSKTNEITSKTVNSLIQDILENKDLPRDVTTVLKILGKFEKDLEGWRTKNLAFFNKNSAQVVNCQRDLADVIAFYSNVKNDLAKSTDRDNDCSEDGPIWDAMQDATLRLENIKGDFVAMLVSAEDYARTVGSEK